MERRSGPNSSREESAGGSAWRGIVVTVVGGVLIAVLGAAALGGGSRMVDWVTDLFEPDPPAGAYGAWTFDHFEPGPPPDPIAGFAFQFDTLLLRDDGTYTATGQIVSAGVPTMSITQAGTYEMRDTNSIRFQPDDAEGPQSMALDISVTGDELRLTDPAQGVAYVFFRRP